MSNWLVPLKRGLAAAGYLGISHLDARELISEGADIIMKQRRTDLMPRFNYEVPAGVAVVHDEKTLELFLAGMIAKAVKTSTWETVRFAYPARKMSTLEYTAGWRALSNGLGRHECHPILLIERDLYCFSEMDWHIAQLKIGVGLG